MLSDLNIFLYSLTSYKKLFDLLFGLILIKLGNSCFIYFYFWISYDIKYYLIVYLLSLIKAI